MGRLKDRIASSLMARALGRTISSAAPRAVVASVVFVITAMVLDASPAQAQAARARTTKPRAMNATLPGQAKAASPNAASNASAPVINLIRVEGNKKIETDAVLARLRSQQGSRLDMDLIRQDVAALFQTGYFYDVQVSRNAVSAGVELVYRVVEKPAVAEVLYNGNDEVEDDDLREAAGLKSFEILNMSRLRDATEKMQKLYEDKGFFLAKVTTRVEDVTKGESVRVVFDIQENEKVKVKRIAFLGNRQLGDNKLKSVMATQEGGFFSFVSESGSYKQDAFDRDIQLLNYVYFNEGYVQVRIDRPQVYVTPDKKGIYITIRVEEGDRFKVGQVDFAGDLLFDRAELMNSIEIDATSGGGGWYVHETLLKDMRNVQAKYGDLGYAYTNVIPRTRVREKDKEVDITFEIDKGNKVYFGRINMSGNVKTRDKVIRRELQIKEGELYNETRKRESIANVQRLGFFDEVNFNSSTPLDNADVMNVDIVVKERNTGTIQVGAGYSTYSQFIFQGQINQINLFGRGQKLGLSVDLSKDQSLFNLNFTEPYFLDTEWTVGFDAYQSRRTAPEYREEKKGGALRVGHPLAPFLRGYFRYKLDETTISDPAKDDPIDRDLFPPETANGWTSSGTFTLEYDKRNDRFSPTDGVFSSASIEYAGLGGEKHYTVGRATARYYKKVWWEFVFRNNLNYAFIRSNEGDNDRIPFNELFSLGGANSLRGYDWYSIGKKRFSNKVFCRNVSVSDSRCGSVDPRATLSKEQAENFALVTYGGTQQLFYQAEIEFPLISEAGIKGVAFFDIGDANDRLDFSELRSDVGFGFRWFSPIGPLRFEWGFPIDRRPEEAASNFQFAIGAPF
ncbi:MAG: outer membrane protein assembly factor BamA [Bdellovibrionaceae bacterium]|nr:outer membrane protein assembly factor BamA [Pseudobdellovibrionaceae bacterium]